MNSQGVILAKQANQKSYSKVKFITLHYFSYIHVYNKQLLDEAFVISRIIKVEVMVIYQPKPKAEADNPYRDKSCFCFFTDGKQYKACKLDMITLRSHVPQSYMT